MITEVDNEFMNQAFALAKHGLYTTAPNPCVGCVIVKDNKVIGQGYHECAGMPHAEVMAMRSASGQDLTGATVYVSLEPCSHYGLTPPCAKALVDAKVARVLCGTTDPNPLVSGKGIAILRDGGIEVEVFAWEDEQWQLNKAFLYAMEHQKAFVTVKFGMSLDAKLALKNGASKWITSDASRSDVQRLRVLHQAILTSASTVLADDPSLNIRYEQLPVAVITDYPKDSVRQPLKVIVDTKGRLTGKEKIFFTGGDVWVIRLSESDKVVEESFLDNPKAKMVAIPKLKGTEEVDFQVLLAQLHLHKIRSVLVEAGGNFVNSLFAQKAVNELITYVAPKILGTDAIDAFKVDGITNLALVANYTLEDVCKIGNDVRLTYKID